MKEREGLVRSFQLDDHSLIHVIGHYNPNDPNDTLDVIQQRINGWPLFEVHQLFKHELKEKFGITL